MTRLEALDLATDRVDKLFPRVNEKGYTVTTLSPESRMQQILKVAKWLMEEDED